MTRQLPARPSLAQLRIQIKELRRAHAAGDPEAFRRIRKAHPKHRDSTDESLASLKLAHRAAQTVIAREYGFDGWEDLRGHVEYLETGKIRQVYDKADDKRREDELFRDLVKACREGDLDRVAEVLTLAPHLVNHVSWYRPPLYFAVIGGHADIVRYLLTHGADPDHIEDGRMGDRSVDIARIRGYESIVEMISTRSHHTGNHLPHTEGGAALRRFVEADVSHVHARDVEGDTPLHRSVALNDRGLVDFMIDAGAEIDAVRDDGFRPIHLTMYSDVFWTNRYRDRQELTRHMLARGAAYTPTVAAYLGDIERLRACLRVDRSNANHADTCGKRPLSSAAEGGYLEIVEWLLEHGADPNLPENMCHGDGFALFGSVANQHYDCARVLLKYGANPNSLLDSSGSVYSWCRDERMRLLVLSYGAKPNIATHVCNEDVEIVKRLLEEDPSLADEALHVQGVSNPDSEINCLEMYEAAFAKGARPEAVAGYSMIRALQEMPRVADLFLERGVRPELVVHKVARKGLIGVMERLIRAGVNLEHREQNFRGTPLTTAARAGRAEMVRLLLSHGVRPSYPQDEPWSTPGFWAERNGHREIVQLLRGQAYYE